MKKKRIKISSPYKLIAALLMLVSFSNSAWAQPTLPNNPDTYWFSSNGTGGSASPIQGMNTALILYGTPSGPADYIFASAYLDGSGSEVIQIKEKSGSTSTVATSRQMFSVPDIIIGNVSTSTTDYIAAVAYVDGNNDAVIDFFDIVYSGGSFTTFTLNSTITVSALSHVPQNVHIDVIADYGYTPNGFPHCDNFVVTWDDFSTASNPNVFVQFGNLNSYGLTGSSQRMNNSVGGIYGHSPDVSGIMRVISSATYDLALVTYVDANNRTLRYGEWYNGTTPFNTRVLNNPTLDTRKPRIDALDDENNNTLGMGNAVYMVAAEVDTNMSPVRSVIQVYDNLSPGTYYESSAGLDISSLPSPYNTANPPYDHYSPTIALGGPTDYRVQHYTNYGTAGLDILFMEAFNFSATQIAECWVNSQLAGSPAIPSTTDGYLTFANSVSGPCNDQYDDVVLYAWAFYNSSATTYDVAYKLPAGLGYTGFRPGVNNTSENDIALHTVRISPNPAKNTLVVSYTGKEEAGSYTIMDIAGRELLHGSLKTDKTEIDVQALAAGTYVVKTWRGGRANKEMLFVKD